MTKVLTVRNFILEFLKLFYVEIFRVLIVTLFEEVCYFLEFFGRECCIGEYIRFENFKGFLGVRVCDFVVFRLFKSRNFMFKALDL